MSFNLEHGIFAATIMAAFLFIRSKVKLLQENTYASNIFNGLAIIIALLPNMIDSQDFISAPTGVTIVVLISCIFQYLNNKGKEANKN